ncbi:Major MR/P fimbria protein precursor [compost metagenome]
MLSTVSVTFEGTADSELTEMLALDASSTAKGVAVGLELVDGTPLAINKPSPFSQISFGSNTLSFNAYIKTQPSRLTNKTLVAGEFTAVSTFVLLYQ